MRRLLPSVLALLLSGPASNPSATGNEGLEADPATGLLMDENWQIVAAHCGACHSTRLVTQNRGDRETWLAMIRWMQDTQGLWPFNPETETILLDYLASNYGPLASSRRQPLAEDLMPPNPYDAE